MKQIFIILKGSNKLKVKKNLRSILDVFQEEVVTIRVTNGSIQAYMTLNFLLKVTSFMRYVMAIV